MGSSPCCAPSQSMKMARSTGKVSMRRIRFRTVATRGTFRLSARVSQLVGNSIDMLTIMKSRTKSVSLSSPSGRATRRSRSIRVAQGGISKALARSKRRSNLTKGTSCSINRIRSTSCPSSVTSRQSQITKTTTISSTFKSQIIIKRRTLPD
jgi:hypothetical protein